jgi:hypothetical protein
MNWADVGKSLLSVAPTLATCIGGPVGVIAGGAISILTKFLGLPEDTTAESTAAALAKLPPDQYLELRKADDAFKQSLLDAGVKLEDLAMQDRSTARHMQETTGSWVPGVLMLVLTAGFFGMLILMWYKPPADGSKDLLLTMIGSLGTAWIAGVTFYYGSSQGSEKLKNILGAGK